MTRRLHKVVAAAAATLVAASALLALGASSASAASSKPPWEPDASSVGHLVFFNSSGHVITGGSINTHPFAAYVQGTARVRAGDTKATLFGYLPKVGTATGSFSGEALTASTAYPSKKAPGILKNAKLPLVSLTKTDESLHDLIADYPNKGTGAYKGVYQLRLKTSGPSRTATATYDSADIKISGSKWSLVYPKAAATKVVVTATPSSVQKGKTVKLKAKVTSAKANGIVTFYNGATVLGTAAVSKGVATLSTKKLGVGKHKIKAKFVPKNLSAFLQSTSAIVTVTVKS
jgi:Bacterial Ig-like domain (group 3)